MIHKQNHSKEEKKNKKYGYSQFFIYSFKDMRHLISLKGIIGTHKEIRKETHAQKNNIMYCKLNLKEKGEKIKTMDQHYFND